MAVRTLGPEDAELFRSLRLEALETNPEAFSSSLDREIGWSLETWTERLEGFAGRLGRILVDEVGSAPVAMAGIGMTEAAGTAILWGMWVREEARRSGSGARLVEAAIAWANEQGADGVILEVARDNDSAFRLYERFGFEHVGDVTDPDHPCFMARLMKLDLTV